MTTETMVKTVVEGANGHPVVVKPHPRNMGPETVELLDWALGGPKPRALG